MKDIAIFGSSDSAYVPKVVMALRSFQRWHPECSYFLLGTKARMSADSLQLLQDFNIQLIDVDEASRFSKHGSRKDKYPAECFYILKGPELLAQRGFKYSLSIDGDVFCNRPLEIESILPRIEGFAGRPKGTLERTLIFSRGIDSESRFDFTPEHMNDKLGLTTETLRTRYEVNAGVIIWNNHAMAKYKLFDSAVDVFDRCDGYFEGDQELLAYTSGVLDIPIFELDERYCFCFFEEGVRMDLRLRSEIRREKYEGIYVVHFLDPKPWHDLQRLRADRAYFTNLWRSFVLSELGDRAYGYFANLSVVEADRRLSAKIEQALSRVFIARKMIPAPLRHWVWHHILHPSSR